MRSFWRTYRPLQLTPLTWALFAVQTAVLGADLGRVLSGGAAIGSELSATWPLSVLLTYLGLAAGVQLVLLACGRLRRLAAVINGTLAVLTVGLLMYRLLMARSIDYVVIADNVRDIVKPHAIGAVISRVGVLPWIALLVLIGLLMLLERRLGWLSQLERPDKRWVALTSSAVLLALAIALPSRGELANLVHEAARYHLDLDMPSELRQQLAKAEGYPYVRKPRRPAPPRERPHIFVLLFESFNARFVERKTKKGEPITPVFNKLLRQGLYVERFYGNSIQSTRGMVAALCSVLPSYRAKISAKHPELRMRCLPRLLARHGYDPLFYSGMVSLSLDNAEGFLARVGFGEVNKMNERFVSNAERKEHVWGWGLADRVFFRKVLADIDGKLKKKDARPLFAVLAPTSNHIPFSEMPKPLQKLHPGAKGGLARYENSMHYADGALEVFFDGLRKRGLLDKSLVVIVGDHSMPRGEHDIWYNELGGYEELFRTPFLLLGAGGRVRPARIRDTPYSQIDIAPTLLERIGLRPERHHYTGVPIREHPREALRTRAVYMSQPYDGTYLITVRMPYKYMRHLRHRRDYLFDLSRDPDEKTNLAKQKPEVLKSMRRLSGALHLNQLLIKENRIWRE